MEYITVGIVLVPLVMSLISLFLNQNKVARIFIQIFAFFFFLSALLIFLYPTDSTPLPLPAVIWKLLTLSLVVTFLIRFILDRQYGISIFLFVQSVVLIITEITVSLKEPTPFLLFNHSEKFILLAGAFIAATFIPFLIRYADMNASNATHKKLAAAGIFMLMSAFSGLVAAESLMGLFLFWQFCFGANTLLIKASGKYNDIKCRRIFLIQQIALTVWLCINGAAFFSRGLAKISDINMAAGNTGGLFCFITLMTAIILGFLVPYRNMPGLFWGKSVPYVGFSFIVLSLLSQFAVMQKLEPLFTSQNNSLLSLIILLGAFMMATAAYYVLTAKKAAKIPAGMVLYTFGWGLASAFTGKEGMLFTAGYTAVSALTIALLFFLVIAGKYTKENEYNNQVNLIGNAPFISVFMIAGMVLYLFAPLYTGLNRILFINLLTGYPVSMLLVITSFAVLTIAIFKWVISMMATQDKNENPVIPVSCKIIVPVLFLASLAANTLSGSIYNYFLTGSSSYLPAKDLEEYARLDEGIYLFKFGTGFVYLSLTIIVLTTLFIAFKYLAKERVKTEHSEAQAFQYSLPSLIPKAINPEALFQTGFFVIILLIAGVSLSCLI